MSVASFAFGAWCALASPQPAAPFVAAREALDDVTGAPFIEALQESGVDGVRSSFGVEGDMPVVLDALWDVQKLIVLSPDVESVDVVARRLNQVDVRFRVSAFFTRVEYTLRRTLIPGARISWVSIAGDVKSIRGSWTVRPGPRPHTTRVVYTSFVDIGGVVPSALVRDVVKGKLAALTDRVRNVAAGAATTSPAPPPPPASP